MEEERYPQEKRDEETEKRSRQDFDDWWAKYKQTSKKWWNSVYGWNSVMSYNQIFLFKLSKYLDVTVI